MISEAPPENFTRASMRPLVFDISHACALGDYDAYWRTVSVQYDEGCFGFRATTEIEENTLAKFAKRLRKIYEPCKGEVVLEGAGEYDFYLKLTITKMGQVRGTCRGSSCDLNWDDCPEHTYEAHFVTDQTVLPGFFNAIESLPKRPRPPGLLGKISNYFNPK